MEVAEGEDGGVQSRAVIFPGLLPAASSKRPPPANSDADIFLDSMGAVRAPAQRKGKVRETNLTSASKFDRMLKRQEDAAEEPYGELAQGSDDSGGSGAFGSEEARISQLISLNCVCCFPFRLCRHNAHATRQQTNLTGT